MNNHFLLKTNDKAVELGFKMPEIKRMFDISVLFKYNMSAPRHAIILDWSMSHRLWLATGIFEAIDLACSFGIASVTMTGRQQLCVTCLQRLLLVGLMFSLSTLTIFVR
jgi:hypothetical protein